MEENVRQKATPFKLRDAKVTVLLLSSKKSNILLQTANGLMHGAQYIRLTMTITVQITRYQNITFKIQ